MKSIVVPHRCEVQTLVFLGVEIVSSSFLVSLETDASVLATFGIYRKAPGRTFPLFQNGFQIGLRDGQEMVQGTLFTLN